MSNSNSSREVTEKKKKDVWQEAGEEFYQESYPSGSGKPDETGDLPRSSRSSIPLPSQTARKNSFGYHNRRRNTFGRTATVTTNTNAYTTYNSTTRLGANHEVHVSVLPDLADMTIPNERKRWNELHRIKSMPINMSAKRELKAQLTTIPMLKLKGTKRLKWNFEMMKDSLILKWRHRCGTNFLWERSLRDIEDHGGTFITGIFMSIKWTVYFNLLLFFVLNWFIILPYVLLEDKVDVVHESNTCPHNFSRDSRLQRIPWADEEKNWKIQLADCCSRQYEIAQSEDDGKENRWVALIHALNISTDGWTFPASLTYGFYQATKLKLPNIFGGDYDLPLAYLLIPIFTFVSTLIIVIRQIRAAIKEVALAREGEFYKFSNLIFAGWDHYTKNLAGAKFKKRILKSEMMISLETEKMKVSTETRKEKWLTFSKRVFVNIFVFLILGGIGSVNFVIANFSLQTSSCLSSNCSHEINFETFRKTSENSLMQFLPGITIALTNFTFLFILRQIAKIEGHCHETEKALLLMRGLIGRLTTVGSIVLKYYSVLYCHKEPKTCTICTVESDGLKNLCWESPFGFQILMILSVDLIFQLFFTLILGYGRYLIGKVFPCKLISDQSFYITKHSLDIIYIQSISWFFYFSPFLPLVILIYSFFIFYLKKFSLIVLARGVHETVRTTRTKAVYVAARLIALTTVAVTLGLVLFKMEPSKGCGPFRTKDFPWEVLIDLDHRSAAGAVTFLMSPRVLIPLLIVITVVSYFYYSSAKANRRMVETLKHMLVLEGHDKQYLFARLNTVPEAPGSGSLLGRTVRNLDSNPSGSAKN